MATSCDGKRPRVVIVGAGVIGLTVGVCLTSQGSRPTHQPVCCLHAVKILVLIYCFQDTNIMKGII